jgi:hypothetical protein
MRPDWLAALPPAPPIAVIVMLDTLAGTVKLDSPTFVNVWVDWALAPLAQASSTTAVSAAPRSGARRRGADMRATISQVGPVRPGFRAYSALA